MAKRSIVLHKEGFRPRFDKHIKRYPLTTGARVDIATDMDKKYPLLPSFVDNAIVTSGYITESRNDGAGFAGQACHIRVILYATGFHNDDTKTIPIIGWC